MEKKRLSLAHYITGFDGIRTIAVIGVILYHLTPNAMRGGYLGVPLFFVVSGYLITDLLLIELKETKKIDVKQFYFRRMKRLYPALVGMLLITIAYIRLFQSDVLNNIRGVLISSLTYLNNWWQISQGSSYFNRFSNASPFTHIWSLAVEGQYYFIWPIVVILLIKLLRKNSKIFFTLLGLAVASGILMCLLFDPDKDPTRVYYGTDTRLFSILMGSALAFVWPSWHLKHEIPKQAKSFLNKVGGISLLLIILSFVFLSDQLAFTYYGGMFLVSIACTVFVAIVAHPGASWNRWMTNSVFTYIGKRSYGIYLWQFPVMILYETKLKNVGNQPLMHSLIMLVLILVISECSYRFIEIPLKRFPYKDTLKVLKDCFSAPYFQLRKLPIFVSGIVTIIALVGFATSSSGQLTEQQAELQKVIEENQQKALQHQEEVEEKEKEEQKQTKTSEEKKKEAEEAKKEKTSSEKVVKDSFGLTPDQRKVAETIRITGFGDSVLLDAAPHLQDVFPFLTVDANVGRQLYNSYDELEKLKKTGKLEKFVLVSLGTNGSWTTAQFEDFIKILGNDHVVFWLNVHVPTRAWQNTVNKSLKNMAKKYKFIHVIDWYSYSLGHEPWFYDDDVHPNETGLPFYTKLVAQSILTKDTMKIVQDETSASSSSDEDKEKTKTSTTQSKEEDKETSSSKKEEK